MSGWSIARLDEAARAALAAIEAPSRPGPLPGSRRVGNGSWRDARTPAQVAAAYARPGAPVPPGSAVSRVGDAVVVRAPFSTTVVLFDQAAKGSAYRLAPGPTLRVSGGKGTVPEGEFFVAVGYDAVNPMNGQPRQALLATFESGGKPWTLWVGEPDAEDGGGAPDGSGDGAGAGGADGTSDQPPATQAIFVQATLADLQTMGDSLGVKPLSAVLTPTPAGAHARLGRGAKAIEVEAIRTHSFCGLVTAQGIQPAQPPDDEHTVRCVTKQSTGPMDRRILGVGGTAHGKPWRLAADELVRRIEAGERFVALDDDEPVLITVATGTSGAKYPLAKRSGERSNVLIGLPRCRKLHGS